MSRSNVLATANAMTWEMGVEESLSNFKAVPPGTGIYRRSAPDISRRRSWSSDDADGTTVAYPDTCVGTDNHTTMINGLGVLEAGCRRN